MTNATDQIIDATLTTLRDTPPPTGLEDRLLFSLAAAQRVPHPHQQSHRRLGWAHWQPSWTIAVTLTAASVFALLSLTSKPHTFPNHVISTGPRESEANRGGSGETRSSASITQPLVILSEAQRGRRTPKLSTTPNRPNRFTPTPADDQALANTLAPSHPAPPLPLTAQERLLLRCARTGQPIEVADLNQPATLQSTITERDSTRLQQYVTDLLHTLVNFQPADPTPPQDETQPPPDPPAPAQEPTTSN